MTGTKRVWARTERRQSDGPTAVGRRHGPGRRERPESEVGRGPELREPRCCRKRTQDTDGVQVPGPVRLRAISADSADPTDRPRARRRAGRRSVRAGRARGRRVVGFDCAAVAPPRTARPGGLEGPPRGGGAPEAAARLAPAGGGPAGATGAEPLAAPAIRGARAAKHNLFAPPPCQGCPSSSAHTARAPATVA